MRTRDLALGVHEIYTYPGAFEDAIRHVRSFSRNISVCYYVIISASNIDRIAVVAKCKQHVAPHPLRIMDMYVSRVSISKQAARGRRRCDKAFELWIPISVHAMVRDPLHAVHRFSPPPSQVSHPPSIPSIVVSRAGIIASGYLRVFRP